MGMPDSVQPVTGFELERYLGKWYEVARLDHSFEKGLSQVTAEYSLREDGGVLVL
ncbi:MAG: lipocalin family protein, partial [Desulfobacteraceae bacterium]|nr:lipocalin family protein [Desulfobacteraceae bacterium]